MKKINYVYLHPRFEYGTANKSNITDMPFMTDSERLRLALWVADILDGAEHEGINKPSWIKDGKVIKTAHSYQTHNVWHYHCGPYTFVPTQYKMTDNMLSENNSGKSSSAIYHYAKHEDTIIILGFSRVHIPFPDANSRTNPIRARGFSWRTAIPKIIRRTT